MKIDTVYDLIYVKGEVPGNDMSYVRIKDALINSGSKTTFPIGIKVPYPTNFQKISELPRELTIEPIEGSVDALSRQRNERTG